MAKPKRTTTMARAARAALLAAIEIYNKPTVEYREQTFAILLVNAWEILLKARIVQQADGKLQAIYKKTDKRDYERDNRTKEPLTISLREAVGRVTLPEEVSANVDGLALIRNTAMHTGILAPEVSRTVLEFGTAGVQNFINLSGEWFSEVVEVPYLLPVGFTGRATVARGALPKAQREMLRELTALASSPSSEHGTSYSVVLTVNVQLNRGLSGGGGTIGITNDPLAPPQYK